MGLGSVRGHWPMFKNVLSPVGTPVARKENRVLPALQRVLMNQYELTDRKDESLHII